ncbi:transcriptional regulator with XRE-family HTH domain [Lachnospiraceae bacterium PF1-22]|uniref:helix-turn-helix domain-containing protein n=1 Tax=Ohessyouella blattaphilus TaxID=2949333 RepID=UPI003E1FB715
MKMNNNPQKINSSKDRLNAFHYKRLRDLRTDNDKTQTEIADVLGTSQTMYARYERGANEIPVRHIIALAQYYHVTADYILGLSDKKI